MNRNVIAWTWKSLTFFGLSGLAFVLIWSNPVTDLYLPAVIGMNALLIGIAVNDLREHRVPNLVTYPLMLIALVRGIALRDPSFLVYWAVLWLAWTTRLMGGGDAKLLMGLFGLFPDFQLAWLMAASILVTGIPYLVFKYRRQWRSVPRALFWRLVTRQFFPSQHEFEQEAVPYAFSFCLAGGAYLWLHLVSV